MGGMLRSGGRGMTQGEKRLGHIARHRDVNVTCGVVPVDGETEVTRPGPVFRESIFGGKSSKKMLSVGSRKKFNAKIINGQSKSCATFGVAPKAGGLAGRDIAERSEVCFELIVCKNGSLLEAIHAFSDLDINKAFGVEMRFGQIVLVKNFGSEIFAVDPHILKDDHIRDQEEVF